MISSLQRFRAKLYNYADVGSGGVYQTQYQYVSTRWCSWVDTGGTQVLEDERLEHLTVRRFTFDWRAEVTVNGLIVISMPSDPPSYPATFWKVVSIQKRPIMRQLVVTAVWVNQENVITSGGG